jgi:MFS transporter, DHA2 family, multidrug resistance protein
VNHVSAASRRSRLDASHNPWLVAFTVTMATRMEVPDTSIANVALPPMAGTLVGVPRAAYPWKLQWILKTSGRFWKSAA